jgi:rhodanese-related sulfurtransferase
MKHKLTINFTIIFTLVALMTFANASLATADVERITKETLKEMLDNPDTIILDVRSGRDWGSSEFKIKGAQRGNPGKVDSWAEKYPKDKTLVFYCA